MLILKNSYLSLLTEILQEFFKEKKGMKTHFGLFYRREMYFETMMHKTCTKKILKLFLKKRLIFPHKKICEEKGEINVCHAGF